MRSKEISALTGIIVGAAGVVALGFLLKKFLSNKKVEQFEEKLVAKIVENSPFSREKRSKPKKKNTSIAKRKSKAVVAKLGNAKNLLAMMKKGKEYSQIMLENISNISYRSVRRYIDVLVKQGKVTAKGYGKGKKFMKV